MTGIVGDCQLGFLVPAILGLVAQLGLRRFRRVGRMLLASVVSIAGLVINSKLVGGDALPLLPTHHRGDPSGSLDAAGLSGYASAQRRPTPGGIGAVEATPIAGLTSAGMASTTAVAGVILFRLATGWIPLLPGWGAFTLLQSTGNL